jgi:hypothetical protein
LSSEEIEDDRTTTTTRNEDDWEENARNYPIVLSPTTQPQIPLRGLRVLRAMLFLISVILALKPRCPFVHLSTEEIEDDHDDEDDWEKTGKIT